MTGGTAALVTFNAARVRAAELEALLRASL